MTLSSRPDRQSLGEVDFSKDLEALQSPGDDLEALKNTIIITEMERLAALINAEQKPANFSNALEQHIAHLKSLTGNQSQELTTVNVQAGVVNAILSLITDAKEQPEKAAEIAKKVAALAQTLVISTNVGSKIPTEENRVG